MFCLFQGQPSGEAFIQMNSEGASYNAATHKNNKYIFLNGKKRYIEVLQCSGEDMNHILLGLVPSNLIPTNLQRQPMYSSHRGKVQAENERSMLAAALLPRSAVPSQMLSSTMPMSLPTSVQSSSLSNVSLPSVPSSSSSSSMVPAGSMNGLHPNATYYPVQVFYYPTGPVSPSIYVPTGHLHPGQMALVLRGLLLLSFDVDSILCALGETGQYS